MFVSAFLFMGNRLRTPPYFLLLQNPLASTQYDLYVSAYYAYELVLVKFLLSPV
jgi:hypothetical protein